MNSASALNLLNDMLISSAYVASPVLIVSLVVSLLQVVTQIQEMTLTFVPKMIFSTITVLVLGGWMLEVAGEFTLSVFDYAASLGRR